MKRKRHTPEEIIKKLRKVTGVLMEISEELEADKICFQSETKTPPL